MEFDINNIEGTFYMNPEQYTLDAGDYNRLLKAEMMLAALMEAGVTDWVDFPNAVAIHTLWEKEMNDEEIS